MNDLISRAEVLDMFPEEPEIWNDTDSEWSAHDMWSECLGAVKSAKTHDIRTETHGVCSDVISRQAAIDALCDFCRQSKPCRKHKTKCDEVKALESLPSADRPTSEWEEIEIIQDAYDITGVKSWASKMMCLRCGFTTTAIEGHFAHYNFCPNCGAKMGV